MTRHRQNLVVGLTAVQHLQNAEGPAVDLTAWKGRLVEMDEDVQRVAVLGQGAGNEAVISRVVHRGIENAIETDHTARLVELVLVPAPCGNFDYCSDVVGRMATGRQLVPKGYQAVTRCIVPL